MMPEVGASMARPSIWMWIFPLLEKLFWFVIVYQFSSSCFVWWSLLLLSGLLVMIFLVSFTGMLVYRFEIFNEAKV